MVRIRFTMLSLLLTILLAICAASSMAQARTNVIVGDSATANTTLHYSDSHLSASSAITATWSTSVIDDSGSGGAIAIDAADQLHISYFRNVDSYSAEVRIARRENDSWQFETVPQNVEPVSVGAVTSLAIDEQVYDHVASIWYTNWTQTAYYATNANGEAWTEPTLLDYVPSAISIAIATDINGHAHITYCTQNAQTLDRELWYVDMLPDGMVWIKTPVGEEGCWYSTSLSVNVNNEPQIAYYAADFEDQTGILKFASRVGRVWRIETVDDTGDAGRGLSLAVAEDGTPHIGYLYTDPDADVDQFEVRYATRSDDTWRIDTLATISGNLDFGSGPAIALDRLGQPHLAYYDQQARVIVYGRYAGGGWEQTDAIETANASLSPRALTLDSSDMPHLTYGSRTEGQVYATVEPSTPGEPQQQKVYLPQFHN